MNKLIETIKENAGAIATACIAFFLVIYYLVIVIPENRTLSDKQNLNNLEEFNKQLNETLKDYVNAIDTSELKNAIALRADSIFRTLTTPKTKQEVLDFLGDLRSDTNSILDNWSRTIIITSIKLVKIRDSGPDILLSTKINFRIDTTATIKTFKIDPSLLIYKRLFTVNLYKTLSKRSLRDRLKGAVSFPYWQICSSDSGYKKNYSNSYTSLINNNIDSQESDSVRRNTSKMGVSTFRFSDKRFYKHSYTIDDTDFDVLLIGAVDTDEFETKAKKVQMTSVINSILLVLLLFLSVPLIKPLISSPKEKLTQFDLINATICIGVFIVVLVSFSLTNYLSYNQSEKIDSRLRRLSTMIDSSFNTELKAYLESMRKIPELKEPLTDIKSRNINDSESAEGQPNLQNYFVMNSRGDLVKDIYVNNNRSFRKNFRERDYFKALMANDSGASAFSAVYSKNNNRFVAIFASKMGEGAIKGFAYTPGFTNAIAKSLKTDYGYLICNQEGRVLIHSDSLKMLTENIYSNNHKPQDLLKLFRGYDKSTFDLEYDDTEHRFYGKRLKYNGTNPNDVPIYLLTFKKLDFENGLKIYTIVNSFIISLAYTLGIILLAVIYSVFFYLGHMSIFSRYHIYWLFPDNSRKWEFIWLKIGNLSLLACFFILFLIGFKDLLYLAIIVGINLVFYNFVLLSQRVFRLSEKSPKRNRHIGGLILTILSNLAISYILYQINQFSFGLTISLLSHFAYLLKLKSERKLEFDSTEELKKEVNKKNEFTDFLSSVICYHYFLVPIVIVFMLFSKEVQKSELYNASRSIKNRTALTNSTQKSTKEFPDATDQFFNRVSLVVQPSDDMLRDVDIQIPPYSTEESGFISFIYDLRNIWRLIGLALTLGIIMALIIGLTKFYTGRFFFFDLSEAYRLGYFKYKNKFENLKVIIPPFNNEDLESLEKYERYGDDENKILTHTVFINQISDKVVQPELKMDLILMDNLATYESDYKKTWSELSDPEKFVMHDFATDHFVNYKSKALLVKLMEKGLVIADPLTGRLRVMNYGFKNFVLRFAKEDVDFTKQEQAEQSRGTFSKWRLPILITAVTILLLVMYLYKQSFDQILVVGGSAISAIGLIVKFLDSYKK